MKRDEKRFLGRNKFYGDETYIHCFRYRGVLGNSEMNYTKTGLR
jgi:hypothetical protein